MIIFIVILCKSMGISAFGASSSPNFFTMLLIHSFFFFVMFPWMPYFISKSCIQVGMFCFICIALPFVYIFLIFLLSPVLSGFSPQVVSSFFLLHFYPNIFQHFSFVLLVLSVFVDFLSAFLVEFPIWVLIFLFLLSYGNTNFLRN